MKFRGEVEVIAINSLIWSLLHDQVNEADSVCCKIGSCQYTLLGG